MAVSKKTIIAFSMLVAALAIVLYFLNYFFKGFFTQSGFLWILIVLIVLFVFIFGLKLLNKKLKIVPEKIFGLFLVTLLFGLISAFLLYMLFSGAATEAMGFQIIVIPPIVIFLFLLIILIIQWNKHKEVKK